MPFSQTWKNLAAKPYGEALSVRTYIREVGENYWSWGRGYGLLNATVPTTVSVTSPVNDSVRLLVQSNTGFTSSLDYSLPSEFIAVDGNNVVFSVYAWSGGTQGSTPGEGIQFTLQGVTANRDSNGVITGLTTDTWVGEFFNSGTSGYVTGGTSGGTVITSADTVAGSTDWSRLSMNVEVSGSADVWTLRIKPDESTSNPGTFIFSAPQIERNVEEPSTYTQNSGTSYTNLPRDLKVLSNDARTISINPIEAKRERYFGVVEGQKTLFSVSNVDFIDSQVSPGVWCAVQAGFPDADVWETVAQGQIVNLLSDTNLNLACELDDGVMQLIDAELDLDYGFFSSGWVSEVQVVETASGSSRYDNDSGSTELNLSNSGNLKDERFEIVFTDVDSFQVFFSNGLPVTQSFDASGATDQSDSSGVTFVTSGDCRIGSSLVPDQWALTIPSDGWKLPGTGSTSGDTYYEAGDTFEFYTSKPRTERELTPIGMAAHLITGVTQAQVYDVMNGEYYDSPLYNKERWDTLIDRSFLAGRVVAGTWKKGSRVIQMIQDALKLEIGTIYPTPTGQIAGWYPFGNSTASTALDATGGGSMVSIINAAKEININDYASRTTVEYLDLVTAEERDISSEPVERALKDKHMTIKTRWRTGRSTAFAAANRSSRRYSVPLEIYRSQNQIDVAGVEITEAVTITDPFLNVALKKVDVVSTSLDVMSQTVALEAWTDPLTVETTFIVGGPTLGDPESVVGSTTRFVW